MTTSASSVLTEIGFSCLKWIKTYKRSSISIWHLLDVALLSIEKTFIARLLKYNKYYREIIDYFSNLKKRRIDLILKA